VPRPVWQERAGRANSATASSGTDRQGEDGGIVGTAQGRRAPGLLDEGGGIVGTAQGRRAPGLLDEGVDDAAAAEEAAVHVVPDSDR
jgi:hypothetical protein